MKRSKRINHLIRLTCLAGAVFCYSAVGYAAVMSNTALPTGGQLVAGSAAGFNNPGNNVMNITDINNAVIKWDSFNIGSIATVNFSGTEGFNVLNYVASGGSMSQIHGTMNAQGGNVYLVNPAGVFIGKSAQIDVGSLYVSNKKIDDNILNQGFVNAVQTLNTAKPSSAELMSLGHINATSVTFDGDRIVLDTEHLTQAIDTKMDAENINIKTSNTDTADVVLGYSAYDATVDETTGKAVGYADKNNNNEVIAKVNDKDFTKANGYMWIEDVEQLQAMNTNLSGNYALRNGIDATNTAETAFTAIGSGDKAFTGKLDGLAGRVEGVDFSIFDLHVGSEAAEDNQGLFANTNNATLKNLIFVSGSTQGSGQNIGTLVGSAVGGVIANVQSSSDVTGGAGSQNVGGIVGSASGVTMSDLLNTGAVQGHENVGGIVGSMAGGDTAASTLTDARNIGQISGIDDMSGGTTTYSHNIGGIAGSISGAALSNVTNDLTVSGGYNVGGIAGSMDTSYVTDATNTAAITATGYTTEEYYYHTANSNEYNYDSKTSTAHKTVRIANVGGIAGSSSGSSSIEDAFNSGDVKTVTSEEKGYNYYVAGNVGGIVGRAKDTVISSVENKESHVFGAHNVGGIAGYLGGKSSISSATNNGGEIMATGARNVDAFVKELIRGNTLYGSDEKVIIGNIGGIVGYMYGDDACITGAGNRGLVHSEEALEADNVPDTAKAANVGGIVGKIDRNTTKSVEALSGEDESGKDNLLSAAVSNSYNTGEVYGYTGIGGIAGMMYNGEIVSSYNLGALRSNYQATDVDSKQEYAALNMGGIVGDTTEGTNANALLYEVYNKGQIGDNTYTYYGRHVGGVVGRLTGDIEKAYNMGEIFNASTATGGIVGWWYDGDITNVFNTGNVTVVNKSKEDSRVGGIAGSIGSNAVTLENAYNLGTIRSFRYGTSGNNVDTLSGIIGRILDSSSGKNVTINNVYTVGNIYSGYIDVDLTNNTLKYETAGAWQDRECAIVGLLNTNMATSANIKNAFYITPAKVGTIEGSNYYAVDGFVNLRNDGIRLNGATPITYGDRFSEDSWKKLLENEEGENTGIWRRYDGTTPILNAFMPSSKEYFDSIGEENISNVQYGTAYDPLLTIVEMKNDSTLEIDNWVDTGIKKNESIAVYGGGLSIGGFANATESNYYGGIIYADGALSITSNTQDAIRFGSASQLYGSSVTVQNVGDIISYGSITAHGKQETQDSGDDPTTGNISISGANVELIGEVISIAQGETLTVGGIWKSPVQITYTGINQWKKSLESVGVKYAYEVTSSAEEGEGGALANGDISITATATDGEVEALLGNQQTGFISSGGSISFTGSSVYVDSDLSFGEDGELKITTDEAVLDISNIGKAQADENSSSVQIMHNFLEQGSKLSFAGKTDASVTDAIIAVDMWDDANSEFNLNQYDNGKVDTFASALAKFGEDNSSKIHIWLDSAEQLQGINDYYQEHQGTGILGYRFALKNDIDANSLENFHGIGYGIGGSNLDAGTDTFNIAFTGALDGRGYSIIGLNASTDTYTDSKFDYVGLFSRIGAGGSVKDLNIISSSFTGGSVGAVAGRNEGTIENVTTFGNRVTSDGKVLTDVFGTGRHQVGAAGGITGINKGTISNVTASDAVIVGIAGVRGDDDQYIDSTAGGIAGVNVAKIKDSVANSAVTSSAGDANALGGVIGINYGSNAEADVVESLGIVNGKYKGVNASEEIVVRATENIGGIAGVSYNGATISNAYNEAHISGSNGVGGIVGYSGVGNGYTGANNTITNAVNAGSIIGSSEGLTNTKAVHNTGGLVGNSQYSDISNARNTGAISGESNVGGMVGTNGAESILKNVTNDGSAAIEGKTNVGGIAGVNAGYINAEESQLINNGTIYGNNTVGGIAGLNTGTIKNTNSNITLYATGKDAMYFGGVAGRNEGTITSATNTGDVLAEGAAYVGGITGVNGTLNSVGSLEAGNSKITGAGNANSGTVTGANYVGGVAGLNAGNVSGTEQGGITEIRNDGYVHATEGGAGGIFGENRADFTDAKLANGGIVYGEGGDDNANSGTGGVIGVNSGNISKSDIIGEAGGVVIGSENVGGLIGVNTGSVAGGRDDGDNYYAHQVYNNGTVVGGTYKEALEESNDENSWTAVDADDISKGYYSVFDVGGNIGGLVGSNDTDGILTAAYNTGNVSGGSNIGGIVGSNAGTIDQVFSVGGVAGNVSALVGVSKEDGTLTNAHGNGVTNINDDNVWKTYGDTKVLKNFLTKLKFERNKNAEQIVYNAHKQSIIVKAEVNAEGNKVVNVYLDENVGNLDNKLILLGYFDTKSTDENAAHSLADYFNTLGQDDLSNLLMGKEMLKDGASKTNAGEYKDIFASQQINISGKDGNPNNLGFDIEDAVTVNKATIQTGTDPANADIVLDAVQRIYGDTKLHESAYGWKFAEGSTLNEEMQAEISEGLQIGDIDPTNDSALEFNKDANEWRTKDANGDYQWTWNADLNDLFANYTFSDNSRTAKLSGASYVNKKELTLDNIVASIIYGNGDKTVDWTNVVQGLADGNLTADNGVVYGDNITVDYSGAIASEADESEYKNNRDDRYTADVKVGDDGNVAAYEDSLNISGIKIGGGKADNYTITGTVSGDIIVNKADLAITLSEVKRTYGNTTIEEGEYAAKGNGLVNGDTATKWSINGTIDDGGLAEADGEIRTQDRGTYKWNVGAEDITAEGVAKLHNNYNVNVVDGNSVVNQRELTLGDVLATVTYGQKDIDWNKAVDTDKVKLEGLVYNDNVTVRLSNVTAGGKYAENKGSRDTADVGEYKESLNIGATLAGDKAENYTITDTVNGDIVVNKADLIINVGNAETTYGTKFDGSKYNYTFGENAGLVNGDAESVLGIISYTNSAAKDGTKDGTNGVWTKDAGSYGGAVNIERLSTLGNYDVTVNAGDATVNKAELTITLNDVTRVYGNLDKADYGYNVDNLTNGDTEESLKLLLNVLSDGAIAEGTIDSPTKTSDAGSYEWTANVSGAEGLEKNYNVKVTDGKSDVTKAHITITVNDQTMPAGGDQPQYTGNISGITNGDSDTGLFGDYSYGPQDDGVAAEVGKHTIGITIDGQYYDLDSSLNNGPLSENYTYEIKSGTLTVTDPTDPIDPTKPIDPTDPSNPDVWQAEDKYPWYQWDKQRNLRERKAEVNFVKGGMAIH